MTNFDEHETASAQYSDRKLVETAMQSPTRRGCRSDGWRAPRVRGDAGQMSEL